MTIYDILKFKPTVSANEVTILTISSFLDAGTPEISALLIVIVLFLALERLLQLHFKYIFEMFSNKKFMRRFTLINLSAI